MVTYEQLFDTLRREKSRDELQVLEDGFYRAVKTFLAEKESVARDTSMAGQKAQIELQNTRRILRELYDRREKKLMTLAMHKTRTQAAVVDGDALQPEERALFDDIVARLVTSRTTVLGKMEIVEEAPRPAPPPKEATPEPPAKEPVQSGSTVTVTFSGDVPKFVGKDMTMYGPFEAGQTAELPSDVAEILVEKGRAQET